MHYVYLLKLKDNSIYTGSTKDLEKRIAKHSNGNVKATKSKRPLALIYYCAFNAKSKALKFEQYLKTGFGQSFRNRHLV